MNTLPMNSVVDPVSIHPRTRLGPVELTVASLDRQVEFYTTTLGFRLQRRAGVTAELGAGGEPLLRLVEDPSARRARGTTGLYHFAVLLPSRRELARAIARLISLRVPNAPTDHLMTETTYLDDPEGNGIELYTDTPEDGEFVFTGGRFEARDARGNRSSGREPLDLEELFRHLPPDDDLAAPLPAETKIGHVHLHVADLGEAVRFYHEGIGFDLMGMAPAFRAAFLSAGGYHHHLGLNTWQGEGAPRPPAGALGLRRFTIIVPDGESLAACAAQLKRGGWEADASNGDVESRDPSGNAVLIRVDGRA